MKLTEDTISKELIYEGKIFKVEKHEIKLPNGETSSRDVVLHNGAVAVLAITPEKEVLVVEQFRKAMEKVLIEIPAGKLEIGEERKSAALRELEEETGYIAEDLELIGEVYGSPGFCNEKISIYLADNLSEGKMKLDEDEFLDIKKYTIEEVKNLLLSQKIEDAKTMIAFQYLLLNYNHSK
ncbi:ADP-ribose pyrophosphatase [Mammaliicoccus lentus]|uniref:NUDIX hydrolase n=1 Tax=Mammaliicoccus TaxID=2803850 RepID=UPI0002E57498|nr:MULTISPECIES: NUDIX hydrolase [Mammaliicoccus]MBF0747859.1 NUDIX hydrolase [Mammaliicoccus lentus]MBF0793211.1 NUDIX hydrolase [Mammaliicoccus lentus]MBF0842244.1 NUDIX hydrolase [Mammaliicoccus lentus]MBW0768293.1 NUDIX hydrolase [Mammaliicoccus lentus]MBW0769866.1 NUDIX hydrolase [Mammaliicoccus lentus]